MASMRLHPKQLCRYHYGRIATLSFEFNTHNTRSFVSKRHRSSRAIKNHDTDKFSHGNTPMKPYAITPMMKFNNNKIPKPPYADYGNLPPSFLEPPVIIHDDNSIRKMQTACQLARHVLDLACETVRPGMTTNELDILVYETIVKHNAYPSPLNYCRFPKSVCTSVNEVICHGIPDLRELVLGDVISLDVSCFVGGVHGDNCATVVVGDGYLRQEKKLFVNAEEEELFMRGRQLVNATKESLEAALKVCYPGGCLSKIGGAIERISDKYGYESVHKYRGHGIGETFHCPPFVKHFRNNDRLELRPGMIFTIEPMIVERSRECYEWDDEWTVVTRDGGRAAQFEHTILITDNKEGVEILTVPFS